MFSVAKQNLKHSVKVVLHVENRAPRPDVCGCLDWNYQTIQPVDPDVVSLREKGLQMLIHAAVV